MVQFAGKWIGVTECNYFLGTIAIVNSFLDREAVYQRPMREVLGRLGVTQQLPTVVAELELRYFLLSIWFCMSVTLISLSLKRVMLHPHMAGDWRLRLYAISKLGTPLALLVVALLVPPSAVRTRYLSVPLGLAYSILTKKMIVFSMAKMKYAAVQWDAVPIILACLWIRLDKNLTKVGADFILGVLCFWYTYRLLRWVNVTINQICAKLGIYCFRLKKRKED